MNTAALRSAKVGRWRDDPVARESRVLRSVFARTLLACQIIAGRHRP
jgi:hypothetical protein